jgi:hypothetical protein
LLGCSGSENDNVPSALSQEEIDAAFALRLSGPTLPPDEKPDEPICTDYTDMGLLRISYQKEKDVKIKLQVVKSQDERVVYNLKADGSIEDFSLQFGSGEYTVNIMQNLNDNQYLAVETKTFNVSISDEASVFLNSIQNVHWNFDMQPIIDVKNIIAPALENAGDSELLQACTDDLYKYICENITYDHDKIYDLEYDYTPDIEKTYAEGKGICYDYSSLLAAMLRSVGIPTKLVKGYASYNPTVYHAWNEVYLNGQWFVIDSTKDASTGVYKPMFKEASDYTKVSEY